jgi:Transmembrane secretion effector
MVPDRLRGRTMAVYSMMFMGMSPVGAILAGAAADRIGAPATVALGGVISIVAAIAFARHLPKIHAEARQLLDSAAMEAGETVGEVAAHAS